MLSFDFPGIVFVFMFVFVFVFVFEFVNKERVVIYTWPTDLSLPSFLRSSGLRSLFPGDLSPLLIGDLRSPFFRGDLSLSPLLMGDLSRLMAGDLSRFAGDLSRLSPIMTYGSFLKVYISIEVWLADWFSLWVLVSIALQIIN